MEPEEFPCFESGDSSNSTALDSCALNVKLLRQKIAPGYRKQSWFRKLKDQLTSGDNASVSVPIRELHYDSRNAHVAVASRRANTRARIHFRTPAEDVELEHIASIAAAGAETGKKMRAKQKKMHEHSNKATFAQSGSDFSIIHCSAKDGCPPRHRVSAAVVFEVGGASRQVTRNHQSPLRALFHSGEKAEAWSAASAAWSQSAGSSSSSPKKILHPKGKGQHVCVAIGTAAGLVLVYELVDDDWHLDNWSSVGKRPKCAHGHPMMASNYLLGGYADGWHCDKCGRGWAEQGPARWFCQICEADVCFSCHPVPPAPATVGRRWKLRRSVQTVNVGISVLHFAAASKILLAGTSNGTIVVVDVNIDPGDVSDHKPLNGGHRRIVSSLTGQRAVTSVSSIRSSPSCVCATLGQQKITQPDAGCPVQSGRLAILDIASDKILKIVSFDGAIPSVLCRLPPPLVSASHAADTSSALAAIAAAAASGATPTSPQPASFRTRDNSFIVGDSAGSLHRWRFSLQKLASNPMYRGSMVRVWSHGNSSSDTALEVVQIQCLRLSEKGFVSVQSRAADGSLSTTRRQQRRLYFFVGVGDAFLCWLRKILCFCCWLASLHVALYCVCSWAHGVPSGPAIESNAFVFCVERVTIRMVLQQRHHW